jgi:hypothetical protein
LCQFFFHFTSIYTVFCLSPSVSSVIYSSPFLPFLYYSDTSLSLPLYLGLVPRDYIPSLNFSVTELFIVLISFLP